MQTQKSENLYTIDGQPGTPVVGTTYRVEHSRKGTFVVRMKGVSGEWATGVIVSGHAHAMLPENEVEEGEELTMRASLCKLSSTSVKLPDNEWDGKPLPVEKWGRDHISTLLYIESVCTDHQGRPDARRMRTEPGRAKRGRFSDHETAHPFPGMDSKRYGTRLKDGFELFGHDDWDCVNDMVQVGLIEVYGTSLDPVMKLTDKGFAVAASLRKQKAEGRTVPEYEFIGA